MAIDYETITAEAPNGQSYTETLTVNIVPTPSTDVLISCALQRVNQQGTPGQAEIAITAYVQGGESHEGNWPILKGQNITSVTTSLKVVGAQATATVVIAH